jgi:uncharacterized protein YkwD
VVLGALLAALLAGCAGGGAGTAPASRTASLAQAVSVENYDRALLSEAIIEETNSVRANNGVRSLAHLRGLDEAADEQAFYMALMFRAEHANPLLGEAGERALHAGITWTRCAENVLMEPAQFPPGMPGPTYTYASLAKFLVACWMESPPHRANLLDPGFSGIGCSARFAHTVSGYQVVFASQVFVDRPTGSPVTN